MNSILQTVFFDRGMRRFVLESYNSTLEAVRELARVFALMQCSTSQAVRAVPLNLYSC